MKLKEILDGVEQNNLMKEFVKFCVKELQLNTMPSNIRLATKKFATDNLTFGAYSPNDDSIIVVKEDRHIADVFRTLAHELVHLKQKEDGKELNGEDGSDTENEANAKAGELMRKFRNLYPEMFSYEYP